MYLTPAQIKGRIKNIAKINAADPITLLRIYMMERFLERLSYSKYKDDFIVKGGILVTSMVGIAMRSTMDVDTTIRNFDLKKEKISQIIQDIIEIQLDDKIEFELNNIEEIMDNMEYPGIRMHLESKLEKLVIPIKIDISTGDVITPAAIHYEYPLLLEDRSISLWSYNLETILAEKIQTVLSRGVVNTRMRDFYDITTLYDCYKSALNNQLLAAAFQKTCVKRKTESLFSEANFIIRTIASDPVLQDLWKNYQRKYKYAAHISFFRNMEILHDLINRMQLR
ncbi:nucleotidyl transferase AbiEii/AbiGii toxin family protein [uncultured Dubosiella sp.]|uniref:nucleotidyl transferase AbiEii/AbiGii toxin family protein n=3 Tax=uncultured Dubosiella sp. TaxID=1937011 RepID=UPI0025974166|nr:nucleotidyl transferase AbiEii/AbiGii toxin family protein [uncultured Dubosiella sp.]